MFYKDFHAENRWLSVEETLVHSSNIASALIALKSGLVKKGDTIVITGGTPNGKSGNSNLINVETI